MYLNRDIALRILGIEPSLDVTPTEIKKAYKKKALNVHPDKLVSSNIDDHNEEFLKVNAAYEFLMKNNESSFFRDDLDGKEEEINYIILFCKFCHAFRKLFDNMVDHYDEYKTFVKDNFKMNDEKEDEFFDANDNILNPESFDIHVTIDVTLNELYCEYGKKIKVKYNDEYDETKTHVLIVPFVDYQKKRCYKMKGDWNKYTESFGDLYVHLNICNLDKYVINECIDKHDLVYSYDISIYDYYNGFEFIFNHFDEKISICHNPLITKSMEVVLRDKGLQGKTKRGDLYIIFNVNMEIHKEDLHFENLKEYFPSVF